MGRPMAIIDKFPTIYSPVCSYCRHLHRGKPVGTNVCDAFPDGVPEAIWEGKNDHRKAHPGDHGIQFQPMK